MLSLLVRHAFCGSGMCVNGLSCILVFDTASGVSVDAVENAACEELQRLAGGCRY